MPLILLDLVHQASHISLYIYTTEIKKKKKKNAHKKKIYAWVGGKWTTNRYMPGWVVFDRPSKENRLFFFSPPEGIRYLYNTDRNWAGIKDREGLVCAALLFFSTC